MRGKVGRSKEALNAELSIRYFKDSAYAHVGGIKVKNQLGNGGTTFIM